MLLDLVAVPGPVERSWAMIAGGVVAFVTLVVLLVRRVRDVPK